MPTSVPPLDRTALARISGSTLGHYEESAESFWHGTRDHDVTQNIDALLRHIHGEPPFAILDLGCGPGRDLIALSALGHAPVGLDGCAAFVEMARRHSGCEVWHQDFLDLALPAGRFHGVFANASLFHVPAQELPRVLRQLRACLAPTGVLFASNPRGHDQEGFQDRRYGAYLAEDTWRGHCLEAGFVELESYHRPAGRPRSQQPWFASVWRRV
ncbi:MAG: class I SAM-dependent methyltransferase [Deltaproteobacteria bacterium]|nr:class I SAM-dependent methyltransferase [Deltaproteobacteria bacterium]